MYFGLFSQLQVCILPYILALFTVLVVALIDGMVASFLGI